MKYYRLLEQRGADAWEGTIVTNSEDAKQEILSWLDTHTELEINKLDYLYVAMYDTMEEAEEAYCDHDIAFECKDGVIVDVREGGKKEYYVVECEVDVYCVKGTSITFTDYAELLEYADDRDWQLEEIEVPDYYQEDMLVY